MKSSIILLAAAFGLVAAVPRRHHHHAHLHEKKDASPVADAGMAPGPTVIMYSLNGKTISEAEVLEGIRNGTLSWANGAPEFSAAASSTSVAEPTPASSSTTLATSIYVAPTTSSTSIPESSTSESSISTLAAYTGASSTSSAASSSQTHSSSSSSSGVDTAFPDGEIDCSEFPSAYGALAVDWMHLGGWSGIQNPRSNSGGFSDIETVTKATCTGGNCCSEGMYCSYACPAGYQKSQWPSTQGATGQSVGGLLCQNGKLHLTNAALSDKICIPGAEKVTVLVRNEMSENAAVCRTDYPGTESETVPLNAQPGTTTNLTCPDAEKYYKWGGSFTSAQYYVNPAGVAVEDACQWGSSANPWGNYAPLNLGVGYSNGAAWLSIFQNAPTTDAKLDFTVTIEGDNVSGTCRYSNGQYCSGKNYGSCSSTTGCTVSLSSGTATFVFSSS